MSSTYRAALLLFAVTGVERGLCQSSQPAERAIPEVSRTMIASPLSSVEAILARQLDAVPGNDETRFALGAVQVLRAVERLGQSLYRHGFAIDSSLSILGMLGYPIPALPIPVNPTPERLTYVQFRAILSTLIDDLERVDQTLAGIRDESIKLPLPVTLLRLDLDGDGVPTDKESLWRIYARLVRAPVSAEPVRPFVIVFDRADVEWLRGYTHLLRGLLEAVLAYDTRPLFERAGHLLFRDVDSPYPFLRPGPRSDSQEATFDLVAFVHLANFRLVEPSRMRSAHEHFLKMVEHSRTMWRIVLAETDDDSEWIPGPRQTSFDRNMRFTDEMVRSWMDALNEIEALLKGTKLAPFWRNDSRGVNLRKVFLEPADFDAVLWVQGTGVVPFLEAGEKTNPEAWRRFEELFRGRFFAFTAWVN